ncbi:MAG: MFS transporter, partial [Oleibacter sp.]|nr:MFS transporter [Thalassolituus sp.]
LLVAFVLMVPMIIVAEKRRQMKSIVIIGAVIITIALFAMSVATSLWQWALLLLLYFWGFNLMEASLPSWLSKIAPAGAKGSAMGIYSTMQFLGAFAGGSLGGWLLANKGYSLLFVVLGALVLLWVFYILLTPAPQYLTGVRLPVAMNAAPSNDRSMLTNLALVEGVADVFYSEDEHAVYLKVKADAFQREEALKIIESKGENNGPQC